MAKKVVEIYTDGACSGNPGAGGWAAVLLYKEHKREISGAEESTTNNRMELTAIIKGLQMLKEPCIVTVYSDSAYSVDPFLKNWIEGWVMRGWRTAGKDDVKNVDLWKELLSLMQIHEVSFVKVKGHADNELNNRCDKLAVAAYKELQKKLPPVIPVPDAPKDEQ
ncbi:MAG: ribonuclease HI [Clostridia bacterium]|nr:ribonuclease HI [Clostridia bacterium]